MICLQENGENGAKKGQKVRSQASREGKFRHLNRKFDRLFDEFRLFRKSHDSNWSLMFRKLDPFLDQVPSDFIVKAVCEDEADVALLDYMRSKGDGGITPSEASAAAELRRFRFKPYHVTRRVQRMNRRLREKMGKPFAESVMRRWVLTSFVERSFGLGKQELEEEQETFEEEFE